MEDTDRDDLKVEQGGPFPGWDRRPVVTWTLLGANVAIWLATLVAGGSEDSEVLVDFGAMFGPLVANGEYWRLFTAMFLHVGLAHLAFNSFGLLIFGSLVERAFGHARFLIVYVLAGLFGSVASYLFNSIAIGAGASGAIFGVLGALGAFFVIQREASGRMGQRNLTGVLFLAAINLLYGLATPGIDNWAHVGGFVAGFALGLALAPKNRLQRNAFGAPVGLVDLNSLARRWWVVPLATVVLSIGAWMGTLTLPDNAYTRVFQAERYFRQENHTMALEEIDNALRLNVMVAEAYLLRGRIYADLGDTKSARSEIGRALQIGDRATRAEAIALLVSLRSRQ